MSKRTHASNLAAHKKHVHPHRLYNSEYWMVIRVLPRIQVNVTNFKFSEISLIKIDLFILDTQLQKIYNNI